MSRRSGGTWQRQWSRARKSGPAQTRKSPWATLRQWLRLAYCRQPALGVRFTPPDRSVPPRARKGLRTHQVERRWRGEVFPPPYWGGAFVDQHGWRTRQPLSRPLPDTPLRSHPRFHHRGRRWGATQSPAVESVTGGIRSGATAAESCPLHRQNRVAPLRVVGPSLPVPTWGPDAAHSESARHARQAICAQPHPCRAAWRSIAAAARLAAAIGHNCARLLC